MTPGACSSDRGTMGIAPKVSHSTRPGTYPGVIFPHLVGVLADAWTRGGGRCERHTALQARRQSLRESTEGFYNKNPFTHAFFPTLYLPNYIPYISLYYLLDSLLFHRRFLTDQLLAIQLRILFNSGTCKVSSPHLVSSD